MLTQHPAYADMMARVFKVFSEPARRAAGSSAEQIAEVIYEAATDEKDQITYVAGSDAKETYAQRLAVGIDKFRQAIGQRFLG